MEREPISGFWLGVVRRLRRERGATRRLARAVDAACTEAFMTGRVYATQGEPESPAAIHDKMLNRARGAFLSEFGHKS